MNLQPTRFYSFGPFRLDSRERVLLRDGQAVPLTPKVAETLLVLVENAGHLVEKEEVMRRVWPDAFVEEGNLSKNIYTLRKLLGQQDNGQEYIETLPKRGYRFTAGVEEVSDASTGAPTRVQAQLAITEVQRLERKPRAVPDESKPVGLPATSESNLAPEVRPVSPGPARDPRWARAKVWFTALLAFAAVALALAVGSPFYIHSRFGFKLTDKDTIVLADFINTTGDPVFDGTLRQGLAAQLEQSPFLNLLSDRRIAQTLALMAQPRDARFTQELAREVCQRTGSAASIEGSIAGLGSRYIVGIKAVNCRTGDTLAEEQMTADGKEHLLKALGKGATKLRERLGESLSTIQKYDAPPENVTTPSLEALQAYGLGLRTQGLQDDFAGAVPLFQRAISLDSNFAMAYAKLAISYYNSGETARSEEGTRKAYELRDRVSDRERFYIDSHYDQFVTGDLEAARKTYELWASTYTRDPAPRTNLGSIYAVMGQYDKVLTAGQETLRLEPEGAFNYANLIVAYLFLNRLDESKATAREAQGKKFDSPISHYWLYLVAFLQHDRAAMEREADALIDHPGYEDNAFFIESDTAAFTGQFAKAREFTRRAAESAERAGEKEVAAGYEAEAALREGLVGNTGLAKQEAKRALALSHATDVEPIAAVALGLAGDSVQAMRLADDLDKRFPKGTAVQCEYLPMIHAASILGGDRTSKEADEAIAALAIAAPYELGTLPVNSRFALYPVYLRGEAYLAGHEGVAAAAEFQKILSHPGIFLNEPIGALSHLGLGRAYALEAGLGLGASALSLTRHVSGHPRGASLGASEGMAPQPDALAKARIAYQDFLALWKDADSDIPVLKQAKVEYAKLK